MTVAELLEGIVDDGGGSPSVSVAELLEVRGSSSLLRKTTPGQPGTGRHSNKFEAAHFKLKRV